MGLTFDGMTFNGSITMVSRPDVPIIGTATATGESTATVSYTAPIYNGGATIISYTAVSTPSGITSTLSQAGSGTITVSGLAEGTNYTFTVYATNSEGNSESSEPSNQITTDAPVTGQVTLTNTATTTWTVPAGVTSVSVVCVGGGGGFNVNGPYKYSGGAGGAALAYGNNLSVTPGEVISVQVGARYTLNNNVPATPSWFRSTSYLYAGAGGQMANTGQTTTYSPGCAGSGGGAGGYLGDGAPGASAPTTQSYAGGAGGISSGTARSGGGNGGAGGAGGTYASSTTGPYTASQTPAAGSGAGAGGGGNAYRGGGVGIFGLGNTGSTPSSLNGSTNIGDGVAYGAGSTGHYVFEESRPGAIRIIWPGTSRQFPSTRTTNE